MVVSLKWMVWKGKSQTKMDENWGYPHFGKPPSINDGFLDGRIVYKYLYMDETMKE